MDLLDHKDFLELVEMLVLLVQQEFQGLLVDQEQEELWEPQVTLAQLVLQGITDPLGI